MHYNQKLNIINLKKVTYGYDNFPYTICLKETKLESTRIKV